VRYVLDTTFVIDHLRGVPKATARLARLAELGDGVFVTEIVACEAWVGARSARDRSLTALLQYAEFVSPGPDQAKQAGRWRAEARAGGRTLSLPDALIAATADALGAAVLTRNVRDFALTPVRVESY
jgi:predicted nucleic acid-binding protein